MEQLWRAFSGVLPLFLVIIPIVIIIGWLFYRKAIKNGSDKKNALLFLILHILFVLSIIGVIMVTLLPRPHMDGRSLQLVPFVSSLDLLIKSVHYTVPIRLLGFNIILFIPFGILLVLILKPMSKVIMKTTLIGMMFSIIIEISQFLLNIGRVSNIDDVILNTLRAFMGAVIGCFIRIKIKDSI
ncbi:VanZ family protein [Salipaludibacillus sp. HK11]|uniref:VanZ family protein n=1 Tax=Salipaludibacillus sp. HK11 TaxID=3394320 RepID=UPI0039FCD49D